MIRDYANIAANERTFLAWVRTGIAVIALGFVIERFNLFLLTVAGDVEGVAAHQLRRLASPAGRYGGFALVIVGVTLILGAAYRFARTAQLLDEATPHPPSVTRTSLLFLSGLVLTVALFSAYLAVG